jgi:tRNA (guanine37-N1)-methyltransferase
LLPLRALSTSSPIRRFDHERLISRTGAEQALQHMNTDTQPRTEVKVIWNTARGACRSRKPGQDIKSKEMRIDIVTIFPQMFEGPFSTGPLHRVKEKGLAEIRAVDLRQFALDKHRTTDDYPFGGGPGMVMKVEPIYRAVMSLKEEGTRVILLSPQGESLNQRMLNELVRFEHLVLICGRYKGVDERVRELVADMEISLGDYVVSGGELPALVLTEGLVRLLPGAMDDRESAEEDSFQDGLLDSPRYTRPRSFQDLSVPEVLVSGDHKAVARWRREMAIKKTFRKRPDLLKKAALTKEELRIAKDPENQED